MLQIGRFRTSPILRFERVREHHPPGALRRVARSVGDEHRDVELVAETADGRRVRRAVAVGPCLDGPREVGDVTPVLATLQILAKS